MSKVKYKGWGKLASALLVSIMGISAQNVYADGYLGTKLNQNSPANFPDVKGKTRKDRFDELNDKHFGGSATLKPRIKGEDGGNIHLRGLPKRMDVMKLQKYTLSGSLVDIVAASKEDAEKVCNDLIAFVSDGDATMPIITSPRPNNWEAKNVIAVSYWIDYDDYPVGGSTRAEDGRSTRVKKHVFCTNPYGAKPDASYGADEDDERGVVSSKLVGKDFRDGYYEVTCVDPRKTPTRFSFTVTGSNVTAKNNAQKAYDFDWRNLTFNQKTQVYDHLHDYNRFVGGPYCAEKL
jgi:hypothetical protein